MAHAVLFSKKSLLPANVVIFFWLLRTLFVYVCCPFKHLPFFFGSSPYKTIAIILRFIRVMGTAGPSVVQIEVVGAILVET